MRYRLRTVMILLGLGPPLLAAFWFASALFLKARVHHPRYNDRNAARLLELKLQAGISDASTLNESRGSITPIEVRQQQLTEALERLAAQRESSTPQ